MEMKEALVSALKEAGRVVVLAVIPVAISQMERGSWDWHAIIIIGVVTLLRFIDKYLHKIGQEAEEKTGEPSSLTIGLTRF
jgi:hypothetical protein